MIPGHRDFLIHFGCRLTNTPHITRNLGFNGEESYRESLQFLRERFPCRVIAVNISISYHMNSSRWNGDPEQNYYIVTFESLLEVFGVPV